MSQLFHPVTNVISKATVFGSLLAIVLCFWILGALYRSSYVTGVNVARAQPVQFSHAHHVGGLGLDCRLCHPGAETADFAGLPPTQTCMNCHAQVWADSPELAPVRESWRSGRPIAWTRVHDLADFAYFSHVAHTSRGIGCVSCHGRVDRMPLVYKVSTLYMEECLACHREPAPHVRPRDAVFRMDPPTAPPAPELVARLEGGPGARRRTDCITCHR